MGAKIALFSPSSQVFLFLLLLINSLSLALSLLAFSKATPSNGTGL